MQLLFLRMKFPLVCIIRCCVANSRTLFCREWKTLISPTCVVVWKFERSIKTSVQRGCILYPLSCSDSVASLFHSPPTPTPPPLPSFHLLLLSLFLLLLFFSCLLLFFLFFFCKDISNACYASVHFKKPPNRIEATGGGRVFWPPRDLSSPSFPVQLFPAVSCPHSARIFLFTAVSRVSPQAPPTLVTGDD